MRTLLIFMFETGDSTCKHWNVPVIISSNFSSDDFHEIEDSTLSFIESGNAYSEDMEYEDIVESVMSAANYQWKFVNGKAPECDCIYTLVI